MTAVLSIIYLSTALALGMSATLALLLFRRWRLETKLAVEQGILAAITRSYLRRIVGEPDPEGSKTWSDRMRLRAIGHIHLLLRGGERERLMQLAELDGLLHIALRQSRRWRSAQRIDAVRLLRQFGSEACIGRLREIMARDRNQSVQLEAAFALAAVHALPPPRETIRLLDLFAREPNSLDVALLRASAPVYVEQMKLLLADALPPAWRIRLIDAIGWCGDMSIVPLLSESAASDCPEMRCAALRAAAKLGHPSAEPWVLRCLDDPVGIVRIQAANSCAALRLRSAVPQLTERLSDKDLWVRLRAQHALEVLVDQRPPSEVREVAA